MNIKTQITVHIALIMINVLLLIADVVWLGYSLGVWFSIFGVVGSTAYLTVLRWHMR